MGSIPQPDFQYLWDHSQKFFLKRFSGALWDQSHRQLKETYEVNPISDLRTHMGSIPQPNFQYLWDHSQKFFLKRFSGTLWDQSHRWLKETYGITPISDLRTHMGSIPQPNSQYLWDHSQNCFLMEFSETLWDQSHR